MNHVAKFALCALSVSLLACSSLENEKVDYKSSGKSPSLEIPPDLTQLSKDSRYALPGAAVSASSFQSAQPSASVPTAVASLGDVRVERSGTQRWLVVNRPAEKLWDPIRDFWQEGGFLLATDQANLGIMETDWAENRAKLPQDFIRNTLGKLFDSLYSTGERDKFRTRLERNAEGGTDVFISHRGMVEVYNGQQKETTVWQPRASDPELEAEFLRRLMVKLGSSPEQSKTALATAVTRNTARISEINGQSVVVLDEGFERAWRRVGLALDRTGFTVEDRDRSKGYYFVRYVEPAADKPTQGFLSKLFSSSKDEGSPLKFRVALSSKADSTTISVQNATGGTETSIHAQRIVKLLADELK